MAEHAHFIETTGFRVHFCDPNSPWKRDTNKNTNVPPRQFFPKGTKIAGVTNEGVDKVQDLLNGRPWVENAGGGAGEGQQNGRLTPSQTDHRKTP